MALAISGWLVGANEATDDFHLAVSLAQVRDMVRDYLREPLAAERARILAALSDQAGATVPRVAQLLKLMKPPLDVPDDAKRGPGLYELSVHGLPGDDDSGYLVQLPPEYDPLRRYPVIVALADAGVPPKAEIEFWAGPPRPDGEPLGPGHAPRLHHDRRRVAAAEAGFLRLLGPRASCRARRPARRLPPLLDRHRPHVPHRPRRRRRRRAGTSRWRTRTSGPA